jgi:hypothetical protein
LSLIIAVQQEEKLKFYKSKISEMAAPTSKKMEINPGILLNKEQVMEREQLYYVFTIEV